MSLVSQIQQIDRQLKDFLRLNIAEDMSKDEKRLIKELKQLINEVRLDVRDYDYAQTRAEQVAHGKNARKRIQKLAETFLSLSSIFGPADIAQLTAQLEQVSEGLV